MDQEDKSAIDAIREAIQSVNVALEKARSRGITAQSCDLLDITTFGDEFPRQRLTLRLERKLFGDILV